MPAKAEAQLIQSVWTRPRPTRREQPALSRQQIVDEAIRLLDEEGFEALSMRRLGARLNAGATSLYTHVANKDELIELVVDEVYGEVEVPDDPDPGTWRSSARHSGESLRAVIHRHPWVVFLLSRAGFSSLGPNMLRITDRLLAVFESGGFGLKEADGAIKSLLAYVVGMGTSEAAWLTALAKSGKSQEEWAESVWPTVEQAAKPYPRLRAWTELARDTTAPQGAPDVFTYGLDRMLDGLEAQLGKAGTASA
jgi:AcrR family transcriptional regulator